jgi:hypothetical protein
MTIPSIRFLALTLALAAPLANAEIITIPVGQQQSAGTGVQLPHHGETSSAVKALYGEPAKWSQAVGEPPISRWEYPGFAVYFEHDRVIHAVVIGSAKAAQSMNH